MSKGSKNRTVDLNAYWHSPLWDNLKNKKHESYTEFSKDISPLIEELETQLKEYKPKRFCFIDDIRVPQNAYLWDEDRTLQQFSGIANYRWDIVRSYDEFVEYIETYGIPHVVSFDNDLVDVEDPTVSNEDLIEQYSMINWKNSKYKMGAHCAEWLCELCKARQHPLPKYYVHSANTAARPVIRAIMEAARPLIKH